MSVLSKAISADHLLAIFTRLSLETLLRLPLLCLHWTVLQTVACRQIHTLTLSIVGHYDKESPISNSNFTKSTPIIGLPLTQLTLYRPDGHLLALVVRTLLRLFPTIQHFNFEYTQNPLLLKTQRVNRVNDLLLGWSASLSRLGVYGFEAAYFSSVEPTQTSTFLRTLLAIINTLPVLKHLTLDVRNSFAPNSGKQSFHLSLPVLARLRSFSFNSWDSSDILLSSLLSFSSSLQEIGLGSTSTLNATALSALAGSPLLGKITHYGYRNLLNSPEPFPILPFIVTHFSNIRFLTIFKSKNHSLCQLFQMLLTLKYLRGLHLFVNLENIQLDNPGLPDIPPLPTVTSLWLNHGTLHSKSAFVARLPLLVGLFPNLEYFYLNYDSFSLSLCSFDCNAVKTVPCTACLRLGLAPLKGCTKLKTIFIEINYYNYPKYLKHKFQIDDL